MTYLVTDNCIMCKHTDCVEVCPVDCFYEGENMLVINPDECIDCGVCEPECPVDAIISDASFNNQSEAVRWTEINRKYAQMWPVITQKKDALPNASAWDNVSHKFEEYFSEEPGSAD